MSSRPLSRAILPLCLPAGLLAAVLVGAATSACAQQTAGDVDLFTAVRARPDARAPARSRGSSADARDARTPAPGLARTSIDGPLANSRLSASLGFLCGLQPTPAVKGAASAYGADQDGRFLGAKLHFAFR